MSHVFEERSFEPNPAPCFSARASVCAKKFYSFFRYVSLIAFVDQLLSEVYFDLCIIIQAVVWIAQFPAGTSQFGLVSDF